MSRSYGWDYGRNLPPERWHEIPGCAANGSRQSPIAIESKAVQDGGPPLPAMHYEDVSLDEFIFTDAHLEIELAEGATGGYIGEKNSPYPFANFHLHTPAEHEIDGDLAAMEIHVVHKHATGQIIALAVQVIPSDDDALHPELEKLIGVLDKVRYVPKMLAKLPPPAATINPQSLYPSNRSYFFYEGSLTTPQCTENVSFFLFEQPIEAATVQIRKFRDYTPGGNNRPIQALNGRQVWRGWKIS